MKTAIISECGKYRYLLTRKLSTPNLWVKPILFIMLNPSTADAELDDPTVRSCMRFGNREQCTRLTVVNLFAFRSTYPKDLKTATDPVGNFNDSYIEEEMERHKLGVIVAAWGKHSMARARADEIDWRGYNVLCLGFNKDGSPRHPLFIPSTEQFQTYKRIE